MSHLNLTRVAYVFLILAVLVALVKLGGADSRSLTHRSPEAVPGSPSENAAEHIAPDPVDANRSTISRKADQKTGIAVGKPEDHEPPVFYRPQPASGSSRASPVCGNLGDFPRSREAIFPLPEAYYRSYEDTWGAPRLQGGHEGTDLMSPIGTPEYAITDGELVPVAGTEENGWNMLGGYVVMLRADYDIGPIRRGDLFYYAHMDRESSLPVGAHVRAGQRIGVAGDTGQGPEVTRGLFPPHLHLGWYDTSGERTNLSSGAMNPYPLLQWLRQEGGAVSGGTNVSYCEASQPEVPTPSTGQDRWPLPSSPGTRPDINTGSDDARPSPVAEKGARSAKRVPKREKASEARDRPELQDRRASKERPHQTTSPEKLAARDAPAPSRRAVHDREPSRGVPPDTKTDENKPENSVRKNVLDRLTGREPEEDRADRNEKTRDKTEKNDEGARPDAKRPKKDREKTERTSPKTPEESLPPSREEHTSPFEEPSTTKSEGGDTDERTDDGEGSPADEPVE